MERTSIICDLCANLGIRRVNGGKKIKILNESKLAPGQFPCCLFFISDLGKEHCSCELGCFYQHCHSPPPPVLLIDT